MSHAQPLWSSLRPDVVASTVVWLTFAVIDWDAG
jgi:hypothetical protein